MEIAIAIVGGFALFSLLLAIVGHGEDVGDVALLVSVALVIALFVLALVK